MKHKEDENLDRLFAAARGFDPDTAAMENYFEKRLLATLRERRSARAAWLSWAWRLIPVFTALAVILGIASVLMEANRSQDIISAIIRGQENQLVISYLTGE
ncbi:MAG: hypothetical protein PHN75_03745 [Syntrophales bacterium]|nr:hypothetical protein [Syntrophales bacterium]